MVIYRNDLVVCVPCKEVLPARQRCTEVPSIYNNNRYVSGFCNGSYRFKYMNIIPGSEVSHCLSNKSISFPFELFGDRYDCTIRKKGIEFSSRVSAICIEDIIVSSYDMDIQKIRRTLIDHEEGYCGNGIERPEVLKVKWQNETFYDVTGYALVLKLSPANKCLETTLIKETLGCNHKRIGYGSTHIYKRC